MKASAVIFALLIYAQLAGAQTKTISQKNTGAKTPTATAHKVMLIPFEPKLYMSEIDRLINKETGLSAKEIKHRFRDGINEQLYKAFTKAKYGVVDLMDDTTRYKKEMESIYQHLSYQYQKVPDQQNYKAPEKEKKEQTLKKGQLVVETNSDKRFMNAKITEAKLVPLLYAKHKTNIFVFINELDIKASTENSGQSSDRLISIHYTVYSYDAKEINSGLAEIYFSPELNNPKKIIEKYFSALAASIVERVNKGLGIPAP